MQTDSPTTFAVDSTRRRVLIFAGKSVGAILILVVFFRLAMALNTRGNDFPIGFQPDESSKIGQILSDEKERNFNHPLLMLEAVQYMADRNHVDGAMDIAMLGRELSAVYGAIAVCAIALVGLQAGGVFGMIPAGVIGLLCPQLILNAHYFKEDAALTMGVALVILGSRLTCCVKNAWWSIPPTLLLGIAVGLAASGKYVGVLTLPMALLVVILARGPWYVRSLRVLVFPCALLATVLFVNMRALEFEHRQRFDSKVIDEYEHVTTQHGHVSMTLPNNFSLRMLWRQTDKPMIALAMLFVPWFILFRRNAWNFLILALLGSFAYALSYHNVLPFSRYTLPMIFIVHAIAAVCLVEFIGWIKPIRRWRWAGHVCVSAVLVALMAPRSLAFSRSFAEDSRYAVRDWARQNLAPGAPVAIDHYVGLYHEAQGRGTTVPRNTMNIARSSFFLADESNEPADLAGWGIRIIIVAESAYARFFDPSTIPPADSPGSYLHAKHWYQALFNEHDKYELIWSSPNPYPSESMANPEIRVYRIKQTSNRRTNRY